MQKEAFKTLINGLQASIPTPNWESSPQDKGYIANKPFYKHQVVEKVWEKKKDVIGANIASGIYSYPAYGDAESPLQKFYQIFDQPLEPSQLEGYEYTYYDGDVVSRVTSQGDLQFYSFGYSMNYFVVVNQENEQSEKLGLPIGTYVMAEFWGPLCIISNFSFVYPVLVEKSVDKFQQIPSDYINFDELPKPSYDENQKESLSYISGRPCYDSRKLIEVTNTSSDYTLQYNGITYYLLQKRTYSIDDLIGMTFGVNNELFILQEDNLIYPSRDNPEWVIISLPNGAKNFFVANRAGLTQVYLNGAFVEVDIPLEGLYGTRFNVSSATYQESGELLQLDEKYLKAESSTIKYNTLFKDKVLLNLPFYEDNYIIGPNYSKLVQRLSVIFDGKIFYRISGDITPIFIDECTILEAVSSKYDEDINYFLREVKEEEVLFSSDKKSFYIQGKMAYINQTGTTRFMYNSGSYVSVTTNYPGLYFVATEDSWDNAKYVKAVCFKDQTFIKKIDSKFLPDYLLTSGIKEE